MTRRDLSARAAELAATPWPSPPGSVAHPQAAWDPAEPCTCDECVEGRTPAPARRTPERSTRRGEQATLALVESAARRTRHLTQRLGDLARALGRSDETEISGLVAALGPEVVQTWSLLESLEVEFACRRGL